MTDRETMGKKTLSTPSPFADSRDSRGVSNVVATVSLIMLGLGLVGTVSVSLGGFTDGLTTDIDGEVKFNQDGDKLTIITQSLSDIMLSDSTSDGIRLVITVQGQENYDPEPNDGVGKTGVDSGTGASPAGSGTVTGTDTGPGYIERQPAIGAVYIISNDANGNPVAENDTVTVTAFDGNGNSVVIATVSYGPV